MTNRSLRSSLSGLKNKNNARPTRVALFVEAHEGLGHFNIIHQLSNAFSKSKVEVLILSGTLHKLQADTIFNYSPSGVVNLPLVDLREIHPGKLEYVTPEGQVYLEDKIAIRRRMSKVEDALRDFRPNVVLFEFYPFRQSFREPDMWAVKHYEDEEHRPVLKFCLSRDIIHSRDPDATLKRLLDFDYIIVRGDPNIVQLFESQTEWHDIKVPIWYSGYFVEQHAKRSVRGTLHTITVFAGGGFHREDILFYRSILNAYNLLRNNGINLVFYLPKKARLYIANNQDEDVQSLKDLIMLPSPHSRIVGMVNQQHFQEIIAQSSLVITRGGYNTSHEAIRDSIPLVIIPRSGAFADPEQLMRADIYSRTGLAQSINDVLDTQCIVEKMRTLLSKKTAKPAHDILVDGADRTVRFILEKSMSARE